MKTGILLVNLGTPDSPSTSDVRKYLREFLNDPRVIDIAPLARLLLVNLIIVPFRASRSAKLYKQIWTAAGSPLLIYSERQKECLQKLLGEKFQVELAMRYQTPSIRSALEKFHRAGIEKLRVIPLFPQYASASTGTVHQKIMEIISEWEVIPAMEYINSYCNNAKFISAFAEVGNRHNPLQYDHILMSFHGLPERQIKKADGGNHCFGENCCNNLGDVNAFCYRAQCFETARLITRQIGIPPEKYTVCFQSRLGRTPWIKPYTDEVLRERARLGDKRILVFAPAFTSDCLETTYEIGTEYDVLFKSLGGEKVQLVESLNDTQSWIETLKELALMPL